MKHICFKIHIIPLQKRQMLSTLTWSWFMLYALVYSIAYAYACSWRRWCTQTRWDIWQSVFGLNIFMSSYICGLEAQVFTPQRCVCVCVCFSLSRRANLTDGPSVWFCQTVRWKEHMKVKLCLPSHITQDQILRRNSNDGGWVRNRWTHEFVNRWTENTARSCERYGVHPPHSYLANKHVWYWHENLFTPQQSQSKAHNTGRPSSWRLRHRIRCNM